MLHSFDMKWYLLIYYYILVIISLDCFLSINTLPAILNGNKNILSDEIYGDVRGYLKIEQYSDPEEKDETSVDCSSSVADSCENIPKETPNAAKVSEVFLIDEMIKRGHLMEGLTTTPDPFSTENPHANPLLIYPGTKWCGAGDIAVSYDDLGEDEETDKCCRAHDSCEEIISGGETKFNLTNKSKFTSLSCECDEKLNECLRKVNTTSSNFLGTLYFNIFSRNCFIFDHPKKCKTQVTSLKLCSEYEPDTFSEKIYQWAAPKKFKKL